jgi:two-component system, OmpR family, response regulator
MMHPKRVLLVDDDEAIRTMLDITLTYEQLEVRQADGVAGAIAVIDGGFVPDVAVVDLLMEPQDGSQLAGWLRQHYPGVRIVVYSAWPRAETIGVLRKQMQADAFVAKPGDISELLAAIRDEQ